MIYNIYNRDINTPHVAIKITPVSDICAKGLRHNGLGLPSRIHQKAPRLRQPVLQRFSGWPPG